MVGHALTANRLAAVTAVLTSLGALVAAFVGVFPAGWQNAALGLGALLGKTATVLMYLHGSQNWDKITGGAASTGGAADPGDSDVEQEIAQQLAADDEPGRSEYSAWAKQTREAAPA